MTQFHKDILLWIAWFLTCVWTGFVCGYVLKFGIFGAGRRGGNIKPKDTGPVWRSSPGMNGYAAEPGTGPEGVTCEDCWNYAKYNKTCEARVEDTGKKVAIKKNSPACSDFCSKFDAWI